MPLTYLFVNLKIKVSSLSDPPPSACAKPRLSNLASKYQTNTEVFILFYIFMSTDFSSTTPTQLIFIEDGSHTTLSKKDEHTRSETKSCLGKTHAQ